VNCPEFDRRERWRGRGRSGPFRRRPYGLCRPRWPGMVPLRVTTVKSSVGMLCGLFRIDLYSLGYVTAIDVVVGQWEVNYSDSERCQTLHIAALWCLLNPRALTSTVRLRHGQFWAVLAPRFPCPLIRGQGPGHIRALWWSQGEDCFLCARYPCTARMVCFHSTSPCHSGTRWTSGLNFGFLFTFSSS
jgi:hypothetical protein